MFAWTGCDGRRWLAAATVKQVRPRHRQLSATAGTGFRGRQNSLIGFDRTKFQLQRNPVSRWNIALARENGTIFEEPRTSARFRLGWRCFSVQAAEIALPLGATRQLFARQRTPSAVLGKKGR